MLSQLNPSFYLLGHRVQLESDSFGFLFRYVKDDLFAPILGFLLAKNANTIRFQSEIKTVWSVGDALSLDHYARF